MLHVGRERSRSGKGEAIIAKPTQGLDKLLADAERKNLNLRSAGRFGKPYVEMVRYATETQPSLLNLDGPGKRCYRSFGSTTNRVIQLGSCPVLAIHT
jgi:nucleotide-binding universal stress UspA family protein